MTEDEINQQNDRRMAHNDRATLLDLQETDYAPIHHPGKNGWEEGSLYIGGFLFAEVHQTDAGQFCASYTTDKQAWRQLAGLRPTMAIAQESVETALGYHGIKLSRAAKQRQFPATAIAVLALATLLYTINATAPTWATTPSYSGWSRP